MTITITLRVSPEQLQLLTDGLAHLEAVDVDFVPDPAALAQVREAQALGAWLRLEGALHRRRHPDSSGITLAVGRRAC